MLASRALAFSEAPSITPQFRSKGSGHLLRDDCLISLGQLWNSLEAVSGCRPHDNRAYGPDPWLCPSCCGPIQILGVIEQAEIIGKILTHLGL